MTPPISQQVTFLYTNELEVSAEFYAQTLQLPLVLDQESCRIYRTSASSFLGICQTDQPVDPNGIIVTLVSDDVDGWYDYLLTRSTPIEKPPTLNPTYNIYHIFLRDPNGYLIEIQKFLDLQWPV